MRIRRSVTSFGVDDPRSLRAGRTNRALVGRSGLERFNFRARKAILMKHHARVILAALFIISLTAIAFAREVEVRWSFPKPGMETTEVNGKTVYQLSPTVTGVKSSIGGSQLMIINIPAEVGSKADKAHADDSTALPNVEKYIAALGVKYAVETPEGFTYDSLGTREIDGVRYYIFSTSSGANVAAAVSDDRTFIFVTPAPPGE